MEGHVPLGRGNTSVGTLAARVLDPLPSLLECVAHVRRLNEFGSVAHGSAVPHLVQLVYQPGAVLGKAAQRSSNARACDDRQLCWKHSDFFQCEYLALANNASASNGTSSGQYRAGRGWRAPVSERGRQASTAMLQRTGMAARP
jgi:hypothetical protein